jgi:hypothetical protein
MFYFTAFTLFPVFLLLTLPIGIWLAALVLAGNRPGDNNNDNPGAGASESEIMMVLAPLMGLGALVILLGLALRLGMPAADLIYFIAGANVLAVLGLMRHGRLVSRIWPHMVVPLLTAFVCYLCLISPLLLDGHFEVLGYNVNNDPVFHSIIPEYIERFGYEFPAKFSSGFTQAAIDKLQTQGYPDGWHHALLLAKRIYGLRAYQLFNMTEAIFAAMLALAAYAWARQAGLDRRWSVAGGAAATVGYLQMSYVFQGFAPQVAVTPFLYGALLALYKAVLERRREYLLPAIIFIQAGLAVYSFTILLWLLLYLLALGAVRLIAREFKGLKGDVVTAAGALAFGAMLNPFVLRQLYKSLSAVLSFSAGDGLGNLLSAAVPILPMFYIWPAQDHRALPAGNLNLPIYFLAALVLVFLIIGVFGFRPGRRLWLTGAVAMVGAIILVKLSVGPYYFAKTLQIAAPLVGLLVTAGVYRATRSSLKKPVYVITGCLLAGALISNVTLARGTCPTPFEQLNELNEINEKFGQRVVNDSALTVASSPGDPALFFVPGEDWGNYLLKDFATASPLARAYKGVDAGISDSSDIREAKGFIWLIVDHSENISPPSQFKLAFKGRFYDVYKRSGPPAPAI